MAKKQPTYSELRQQVNALRDEIQWNTERVQSEERLNRELEGKLRTIAEILAPYITSVIKEKL